MGNITVTNSRIVRNKNKICWSHFLTPNTWCLEQLSGNSVSLETCLIFYSMRHILCLGPVLAALVIDQLHCDMMGICIHGCAWKACMPVSYGTWRKKSLRFCFEIAYLSESPESWSSTMICFVLTENTKSIWYIAFFFFLSKPSNVCNPIVICHPNILGIKAP